MLDSARAAAEKLAKALGFSLIEVETNPPPRCIWIEVRPFTPNPVPGYVIIHSGEGTLITASDQPVGWMPQWSGSIKSSRERNGHREARFGLATSFDLAR